MPAVIGDKPEVAIWTVQGAAVGLRSPNGSDAWAPGRTARGPGAAVVTLAGTTTRAGAVLGGASGVVVGARGTQPTDGEFAVAFAPNPATDQDTATTTARAVVRATPRASHRRLLTRILRASGTAGAGDDVADVEGTAGAIGPVRGDGLAAALSSPDPRLWGCCS